MAASLTASFILKLEDKLSSGIVALSRKLESLAALARKVSLGGLDGADRALDRVGGAADRVSRSMDGIGRSARSAVAEIKRLSSQPIMVNGAGTAFLPPSVSRGIMAAAVAAAVGAGSGGGRVPTIRDASFFGGPQLQLSGPGGGGIELQPGRIFAARGAWSQLRGELARTAQEAQRVGQELGHAGHRAFAAAATGFGIYHMVHSAAEVDSTLRQAAIAQGLSGPAVGQDVARMMKLVSEDATRTGQSVPGLAEAYGDLVARGLPPSLVDELIKTHSTAATAYHIDPVALGQTVFSLNKTLGIGHEDMGGAIAALAQSTHAGSFKMGDFARYLPQVAGQMKALGWTGRGALDSVASMLEVVSGQSGTPEETATNFKVMLQALTAKYSVKSFKRMGIDLPAEMAKATKAGKNPVDAQLDLLEGLIKGVDDPMQQAFILGNVLHNQQAGSATQALLQNRTKQRELSGSLHGVGADKLLRDFQSAMEGLQPQLNRLSAEWQVFEMRLGTGLAPLISPVIGALHGLNAALAWMDESLPGVTTGVLTWGGGFVMLITVLGVLIPLFKAFGGGVMLLFSGGKLLVTVLAGISRGLVALQLAGGPILWIISAIAAAAYLIYRNWDTLGPYFKQLWRDITIIFRVFWAWLTSWIGPTATAVVEALKAAWNGLSEWFSALWARVAAPFDAFLERVRTGIAELRRLLQGGTPDNTPVPPEPDGRAPLGGVPGLRRQLDESPFGATPMSYRPGGRVGFEPIEIHVTTDGNVRAQAPRRIQPIDLGPMPSRA